METRSLIGELNALAAPAIFSKLIRLKNIKLNGIKVPFSKFNIFGYAGSLVNYSLAGLLMSEKEKLFQLKEFSIESAEIQFGNLLPGMAVETLKTIAAAGQWGLDSIEMEFEDGCNKVVVAIKGYHGVIALSGTTITAENFAVELLEVRVEKDPEAILIIAVEGDDVVKQVTYSVREQFVKLHVTNSGAVREGLSTFPQEVKVDAVDEEIAGRLFSSDKKVQHEAALHVLNNLVHGVPGYFKEVPVSQALKTDSWDTI